METKTINMSNANHKVVVEAVHKMANKEKRSVANMTAVLLTEALCARAELKPDR